MSLSATDRAKFYHFLVVFWLLLHPQVNLISVQYLFVTDKILWALENAATPDGTGTPASQIKKLVLWNQSIYCWLSPETVSTIRDRVIKKTPAIHAEVNLRKYVDYNQTFDS